MLDALPYVVLSAFHHVRAYMLNPVSHYALGAFAELQQQVSAVWIAHVMLP